MIPTNMRVRFHRNISHVLRRGKQRGQNTHPYYILESAIAADRGHVIEEKGTTFFNKDREIDEFEPVVRYYGINNCLRSGFTSEYRYCVSWTVFLSNLGVF
jgi:hypothetical protein